jgi:MFS family permease
MHSWEPLLLLHSGLPLAVIIGGMVVDIIGMKRLLLMAFLFHLIGIVLTIFANGFWSLFLSTLMIGIANGTVEAACNPLVASLYPNDKNNQTQPFPFMVPRWNLYRYIVGVLPG